MSVPSYDVVAVFEALQRHQGGVNAAEQNLFLDAIGNLHKERLPHVVEPLLDAANRVVQPAITSAEVAGYYKWDARMWAVLQRLRRADRWWQRTVRRRRYAFLLPGKIER